MERDKYIVGYCGVTASDLIGPTVETKIQAIEAFNMEYPAVSEREIQVRTITATYDESDEEI